MTAERSPSRTIARRLVPWAALMIIVSSVLLGYFAIKVFDTAVEPELNRRTHLIGSMIRANIQLALDSGIPMEHLTGVDAYLDDVLDSFDEVLSITLTTETGSVISEVQRNSASPPSDTSVPATDADMTESRHYRLNRVVMPILDGNKRVGRIVVEIDRQFITTQFRNIFLDIAVVIIVAMLLAFEIMLSVVSRSFIKPLDRLVELLKRQAAGNFSSTLGRASTGSLVDRVSERFSDHAVDLHSRIARLRDRSSGQSTETGRLESLGKRYGLQAGGPSRLSRRNTVDIRLPFFLFVIAEELSKPFLPLYIKARLGAPGWIGEELLISFPLVTYLAFIALLSPFARSLIQRFGSRHLFLFALIPVVCSHVGMALSDSVWEIMVWRGIVGGAYALITLACQDYALASVEGHQPGRAMGSFIAVLIGGTFCGTALGGVMADRLGQSNVFFASALVAILAGALALRLLDRDDTTAKDSPRRSIIRDLWRPFRNRRIATLLLGISIPTNALAVALLWFLLPLLLSDLGVSAADTGRVMMLYYLCIILLGPIVAARSGSMGSRLLLMFLGGALSGGALLIVAGSLSFWHLTLAVLAVGIGHSLLRAPLMAACVRIADEEFDPESKATLLGTLQMVERIGSAIGLVGIAILVGHFGFAPALAVTGTMAVIGTMVYAVPEALRLQTARSDP